MLVQRSRQFLARLGFSVDDLLLGKAASPRVFRRQIARQISGLERRAVLRTEHGIIDLFDDGSCCRVTEPRLRCPRSVRRGLSGRPSSKPKP